MVLGLYCVAVALAALAGGAIPMLVRLTHRRLQVATSLIGGFMLGVALLHLLPHAAMGIALSSAVGWMLAGLLTMFFLERVFSYHHHTAPPAADQADRSPITADPQPARACGHEQGPAFDHARGHGPHGHDEHHGARRGLSWVGVGAGLAIHSLINGAALAAAVLAQAGHATHEHGGLLASLPGLAVFLVVALHKPFDSMTLLTLMTTSGMSLASRRLVNGLYALCVPGGAAAFVLGLRGLDLHESHVLAVALAFAAGMFLCVALADLLPEVQFHTHDRLLLSATMLLGLALAWAINALEAQVHDHSHVDHLHSHAIEQAHDHDHGHDHAHDRDHDHGHAHDHDH